MAALFLYLASTAANFSIIHPQRSVHYNIVTLLAKRRPWRLFLVQSELASASITDRLLFFLQAGRLQTTSALPSVSLNQIHNQCTKSMGIVADGHVEEAWALLYANTVSQGCFRANYV
ncbi:hypothetical protein GGR58DRAFT_417499 [Xylaria digitata]|nr:hypothetical protein GGR58DRAFT_417499 [Xylaria digitata]